MLRSNYFFQNLLKPGLAVAAGYTPRDVGKRGVLKCWDLMASGPGISMVDARDVGHVAAVALLQGAKAIQPKNGGNLVDITGGEAVTMTDVAAAMERAWGRRVRCQEVSLSEALQELVDAGAMPDAAAKVSRKAQGLVVPLALVHFELECSRIQPRCSRTALASAVQRRRVLQLVPPRRAIASQLRLMARAWAAGGGWWRDTDTH